MRMAYQQLVNYDWSKGLAGTGEIDYGAGYIPVEAWGPEIAESWTYPEVGTWVFKIRKGVHYALDPTNEASRLMNGRELTADDVVWNVWRLHFDPRFPVSSPRTSVPQVVASLKVDKTGPWEVTIKIPGDPWNGFFWVIWGGCSQMMYGREVIEKYGNADDWRRVVGTGPFMWSDYVSQSVATYTRNPNYWKKDPAGPGKGQQLPYAEKVKLLVVPDTSTRQAAIRTGRADWDTGVPGEDARGLLRTNPQLQSKRYLPGGFGIDMRHDVKETPFSDKKVRQALMMATDFEAIAKELYDGDAEILVWPKPPTWPNNHVPLKELPESVQALYKYNPEKAKQLLAEAGYPKGFKTNMIVQNISSDMDSASVFKAMWAKVGIDVELRPREFSVFNSIYWARSWDQLNFASFGGTATTSDYALYNVRRHPGIGSYGKTWTDPVIEETYQAMQKHMFFDMSKADAAYRKMVPHVMEQAYIIPRPTPYSYTIWQPWIKNHHGEASITHWLPFAWVDQDLKEKVTGRR